MMRRGRAELLCAGGFSLIELLVVVSIIAILASLLLGGIKVVKRAAQAAVCASNLRQIGMAIDLYSQDNAGYLPTARMGSLSNRYWFSLIGPYTDAKEKAGTLTATDIHDDRARNVVKACPNWMANNDDYRIGYGMNGRARYPQSGTENSWDNPGGTNFPDWQLSQVTRRSSRTMIGDSGDWHIIYAGGWYGLAPYRHGREANYLMYDYHVSSLPYAEAEKSIQNP